MPLKRLTDGERLAVVETEIDYLQTGDRELKDRIQVVEDKLDLAVEKLDMVIAGQEAYKNQVAGASKLAIIVMKAWPIAAAALGSILAWEHLK